MITFEQLGLERFASNPQYAEFLGALNAFVAQRSLATSLHTVCVTGSFVRGELKEGSDVDIDIIDPTAEKLTQEIVFVAGVKIDCCTFSWDYVHKRLESEELGSRKLFADEVILWRRIGGQAPPSKIVAQARTLLNSAVR